MIGIHCSDGKFEFTTPVRVWLPLCTMHIQWQRHLPQKSQGEPRHFSKAGGKHLPKEYWREYPLWAWPDGHFSSFWVMQLDSASELFMSLTPPALREVPHRSWSLTAGKLQWLWDIFLCHSTSGVILQNGSSTFPVHPTALTLLQLSRSVTFCYSRAATLRNYKTSSKVDLIALPSFVLENVTGHVFHDTSKIAFKTSVIRISFSSQQIDTSLPHLMSENSVSVSHTSWSASSCWTHSKPIS